MTLYRWLAQGDSSLFFLFCLRSGVVGVFSRDGHDGSILSGGRWWVAGQVVVVRPPPNAIVTSYLSIDSTRSSGSQSGVQGPRRRWGFETRSETPFATRSVLDGAAMRFAGILTRTDAFIATNWVLSDTRLSSAPHDGAWTAF